MAKRKDTANWWDGLTINSYKDFTAAMTDGKFTLDQAKTDYGKIPPAWRAFYDKYIVSSRPTPANPKDAAAARSAADSATAKKILEWNRAQNDLAVARRNLIAAQDSQNIYNRAKDKTGLKNYQSLIDELNKKISELMAITK